jgi:hypothetical protein
MKTKQLLLGKNLFVLILATIFCTVSTVAKAGDTIVFKQDFSKITSLKDAGWKSVNGLATKFELKDGCLEMFFAQAPYKGGHIHHEVPLISKGTLSFELALDTNREKYDHFSFKISMYNITLSFKKVGSRHDLIRYYNGKWKVLANNVPLVKKFKVKISFDNEEKIVQYFIDDMESPVMIDEEVILVPEKGKSPILLIGNYGLATGNLEHKIYNIELAKETD